MDTQIFKKVRRCSKLLLATMLFILVLARPVISQALDGCTPPDPSCHPSCIVYDTNHCRLCRCPTSSQSSSSSSWASGGFSSGDNAGTGAMSTDAAWDKKFDGDWSSKLSDTSAWSNNAGDSNAWQNTGSGSSDSSAWGKSGSDSNAWQSSGGGSGYNSGSRDNAEVRYIVVEREPVESYPPASRLPSLPLPNRPVSPFTSIPRGSGPVSPGRVPVTSQGYSSGYGAGSHSASVVYVPLVAPGQPRYCVTCHILSCPGTCERVDEYGCHSCPCAPSRFQTMPVMRDCSAGPSTAVADREPECRAMLACIRYCKAGYKLGATDRDGCRQCSCIKAPPKHEEKSCPATVSCMLKCTDGYILGDTQRDGCPSCKCLSRGVTAGSHNTGYQDTGGGRGNGYGNSGSGNGGGRGNSYGNSGSGNGDGRGNSYGNSGSGNGGERGNSYGNSGSGNGAGSSWTKGGAIGGSSNSNSNTGNTNNANMLSSTNGRGSGECKPPMCLDGHMSVGQAMSMGTDSANGRYTSGASTSMTSGMTSPGGSTSGSSSSNNDNCFPMCAGGSNTGYTGGHGASIGGSTGSSNSGCSGPFCATMSGNASDRGGMGSGSSGMGSGTGRMGSGSSGMGARGGMGGLSGMGAGLGGMKPGSGGGGGSGMPFSPFSAAMSSRGQDAPTSTDHRNCSDLMQCLVTCNNPLLGDLDEHGCQQCSCA